DRFVVVRWSELPPERLEIELAKLGLTINDLLRDAYYVPELQPMYGKLWSKAAKQRSHSSSLGTRGILSLRSEDPCWVLSPWNRSDVAALGRDPTLRSPPRTSMSGRGRWLHARGGAVRSRRRRAVS